MKIAVISTMKGYPWGGSEELWAEMVNDALEQKIETIVSIYDWHSMPSKISIIQQKGAVILQRPLNPFNQPKKIIDKLINKLVNLFHHVFNIEKTTSLFKELFALKPDVVCISQGSTYDFLGLPELLQQLYCLSIPYVVVCQFNSDTTILNQSKRKIARDFFNSAYHVAFVSQDNSRTAEHQLAKAIPNAIVVKNPVNISEPAAIPWPTSKRMQLACVARLDIAYKGQDILFKALSSSLWRSRDWCLSLYGSGPDRDYLEELAKHYGISERIYFQGHTQALKKVWFEHHILVLPSRAEGTPLSLVEAMLCGRPAIVTDVGGNTEWIEEQKTGFIADAPTSQSFGKALERAWLERDCWETMGLLAHQQASIKYDKYPGQTLLKIMLEAAQSEQPK